MQQKWILAAASLLILFAAACTTPEPTIGPAPTVSGIVTAGPTCPVEASPEPSACAPRPVSGAVVIASAPNGTEITRATTDSQGAYLLGIASAGTVVISALPVPGLAQPPAPVTVDVAPNGAAVVNLEYDTGIR
jgi:hypothetical protein